MIARFWPLFFLIILLPDYFLYRRYVCRYTESVALKVAWWIPTVVLVVYTIILFFSTNFVPENQRWINFYLLVLGVFTLPKVMLAFVVWIADWMKRKRRWRHHFGMTTGVAMGLLAAWPTAFGAFAGFQQFDVNSVDCYFSDLPEAFDGYRIALFSDAHVGSYTSGDEKVLEAAVDSLLAMKADAIFFLGDIQNVGPWELREKLPILGRLKAPDGVFSILGNHDYSTYIGGDPRRKLAYEKQTVQLEREMGWRLLLNDNYVLRHGNDSIYFCGMEDNEKVNTDHGYGRIEQAVEGVGKGQFAILLAHNPKVWRRKALPESNVQLTLSGHTHGGQVSLFGFSTTSMFYDEDKGLYQEGERQLFVTKGLGALIPLRFNVNGEVVLLTLHRKTSPQQQSSYNEK